MNLIEKLTVKRYHSYRTELYPDNPAKALGWTSKAAQQIRFDVILSMLDFNGKSVLDLGCGRGDFKVRLDEVYDNFDYIGIDQQAEFIRYAQQAFKNTPNTWFYEADFSRCKLPQIDIVVASGVLSYFSKDTAYYFSMIQRFYESAQEVLIFNMLDQTVFDSGPLLVAHDTERIFRQCKELCPNTILKNGYLANDFTLILARQPIQKLL